MDTQTIYKLLYLGGDIKNAMSAAANADKAYAELVRQAGDALLARATGKDATGPMRHAVDAARAYAIAARESDYARAWAKDQAAKIGDDAVTTATDNMVRAQSDGESARRTYQALVWLDPEQITDEWSDLFDGPEWIMDGFDADADPSEAHKRALAELKRVADSMNF